MVHRAHRRGRLVGAILLTVALLGGCGSEAATSDNREADAYILVLEWVLAEPELAPEPIPDELPVVYVESLGPAGIDLDVQVEVIGHFEGTEVDIRFIDTRTEALDDEALGTPVRDGGTLVGLGALASEAPHDVRGEVYRTEERIHAYLFQFDLTPTGAALLDQPESVRPEGLVAEP